jgi:acetoacetyl-CoA synthetase
MVDASPVKSDEAPLWTPSDPSTSQTTKFREHINEKHNLHLETYEQLWEWSCSNRGMFWREVWDFEGVVGQKGGEPFVDESARPSQNPAWFPDASLNWAENQLRHYKTHPRDVALIQISESCQGWTPPVNRLEQEDLYRLVGKVQRSMKKSGLEKGDRVAYWGGNTMEAVVVLLATSSLGGIFSSAAADFGTDGVIERMTQIRPKLLGVFYHHLRYCWRSWSSSRRRSLSSRIFQTIWSPVLIVLVQKLWAGRSTWIRATGMSSL